MLGLTEMGKGEHSHSQLSAAAALGWRATGSYGQTFIYFCLARKW